MAEQSPTFKKYAGAKPRGAMRGALLARPDEVTQTARDLMHVDTVTVPANATLPDVLHLLVVAGIGGAPVVGQDGSVVGILTSTDVLRAIAQAVDEDQDVGELDHLHESLQMITADEIATPDIVWVPPETTIAHVAATMRVEGIHRVLVGSSERLEGILTSFDLLSAV